MKLLKCSHCGNIVELVESSGVLPLCCGEEMKELVANTTDAAVEKHVPVIEVSDQKVSIKVGSVAHPMTPEHHISFIILETSEGLYKKYLDAEGQAVAEFALLEGEKAIAAYEYCNLHGFWKASI